MPFLVLFLILIAVPFSSQAFDGTIFPIPTLEDHSFINSSNVSTASYWSANCFQLRLATSSIIVNETLFMIEGSTIYSTRLRDLPSVVKNETSMEGLSVTGLYMSEHPPAVVKDAFETTLYFQGDYWNIPFANFTKTFVAFNIGEKNFSTFGPRYTSDPICVDNTGYCIRDGGAMIDLPWEKEMIYLNGVDQSSNVPVRDVLTLDTTDLSWRNNTQNITWPDAFEFDLYYERAVFLPVGKSGILVVIGSADENPGDFNNLKNINIYDLEGKKWYTQPASGTAPDDGGSDGSSGQSRAFEVIYFCVVAASASDRSSHQIYFFGGLNQVGIYILSIPSFTWVQVNTTFEGEVSCIIVGPRHTLIMGACPSMQLFDLSTLQLDNLTIEGKKYDVPAEVISLVGGDASGGATLTSPVAGWQTPGLASVFSQSYLHTPVTPLAQYLTTTTPNPTNSSSTTSTSSPTNSEALSTSAESQKTAKPKALAPIIGGSVGGVALVIGIAIFVFFSRNRWLAKVGTGEPIVHNVEGPAELKGRELVVERHEKSGREILEMDVPAVELEAHELLDTENNVRNIN
ncbi:hypothetical protein DL95DRAFT_473510 [Leptodontidium sp. 2 PMI_412]|nr:hypothetical protein DL95DRAFT_473510 [Leptodontidium sp. 2 PMI_412]